MKSIFTRGVIAMLCLTSICYNASAQSPTITSNITIPTGNANSKGVAFGNGVYITILGNGTIYQSTDGDNWTKVVSATIPTGTFNSIAFGAGLFVVVGNDGLLFTSPDGTTWTTRTSSTANTFYNVQFLQGQFFAVGNLSTIRSSADGITWSVITLSAGMSNDLFLHITYGSGIFAITARGNSGGSYVYKSATGASNTWSYQTISAFLLINRIQYLKDRFFCFFAGNYIYTSPTGATWTDVTASVTLTLPDTSPGVWNNNNQIFNGIYDGTKFCFFGSSQFYSGYGSVWTSTTGLDITLQIKTAYIVPQSSAYINGKYFQCGNEGIVSSNDGISYKYPTGNYGAVASSGSSYVGVGTIGQNGVIFSSNNFNTLSEKTPTGTKELNAIVYTAGKYIAAGNQVVMESADNGETWSTISTPVMNIGAMANGAGTLVASGYHPISSTAQIAYSVNNGSSWTVSNTANNWYYKVKQVNGNFFALGYSNADYSGVIMHSADGITWSNITPNLPFLVYHYHDVVYDGTKYHFMGQEIIDPDLWIMGNFFSISTSTIANPNSFINKGEITTSLPGLTVGGDWGQGAFAYSNGHFVGAANDLTTYQTYVLHSSDGVSWTAVALDENTNIFGIVANGNTFNLIGTGDGKITVAYGMTTLPVTLSSFKASLVNEQSLLQWQTVSETNSDRFIVQHSTNAINWQSIGTVAAAGNSQTQKNYQFIHTTPAKGKNFYRLVQVDADSKQEISAIRQVVVGNRLSIAMYPNPATASVQLELPEAAPATITIYNAAGQPVYHQPHSQKIVSISLAHLPAAVYRVVVQQAAQQYTQTLLHQ